MESGKELPEHPDATKSTKIVGGASRHGAEPADGVRQSNSEGKPAVAAEPAQPQARSILSQVRDATGLDPADCYQCGKCSAGCPMATEMDLKTHEIIRLLQLDMTDRLLNSDSIWMCLTCETCTTRCPNEFDPAVVIDALREITLNERPYRVPGRIAAFHSAFLDQIRTNGRVFEFGLVASYKLRSGVFFADIEAVPAMLARGKLALAPKRIEGISEVRRIFDRCATEEP